MENQCISQRPNKNFVRWVRDVSVVHVNAVAATGQRPPAAGAGGCRAQRIRHVLDQLVHGGRGRGRVPQRRAGARVGVGVRGAPLLLHRGLRDLAAGLQGAGRAVPVQTERPHRLHGLQRGGSAAAGGGARQAVPRRPLPSHEQQLQPLLLRLLPGAVFPRHPGVGEPAGVRELVRALPAALLAQGVADAGGAATLAGGTLALLHAADAAIASRIPASAQLRPEQCCVKLLNRRNLGNVWRIVDTQTICTGV